MARCKSPEKVPAPVITAPEQHLLEYNVVVGSLPFRFPGVGAPSFAVTLAPSTMAVVP